PRSIIMDSEFKTKCSSLASLILVEIQDTTQYPQPIKSSIFVPLWYIKGGFRKKVSFFLHQFSPITSKSMIIRYSASFRGMNI
ncbi:MAG: hypothetical protein COA38_17400, partial [Fluviicola sp.]